MVPKRNGTPVAAFAAEQPINRHAGELAGRVKKRHLQAGAQAVVPHRFKRSAPNDALVVVDATPGIVLNGFTPAYNTGRPFQRA